MAYNTLSGTVEFAGANGSLENTVRTDDFDQSIDGKKTFIQRITCSAITLNGTVLTVPAITSVTNAAAGRVSMFNGAAGLSGSSVFTYAAGGILTATIYSGSGQGLTNIRTDQFQGTISASHLVLGNGVKSDSGVLIVSGGAGINVTATGVKPSLDTYGGLNLNATTLMLDTSTTYDISEGGQSLATGDKFFVQDIAGASPAAPALRSMTVGTLTTYLQSNLTFSPVTTYNYGATHRVLTAGGANTIDGEPNLTFDGSLLTLAGDLSMSANLMTSKLTCSSDAYFSGAVGVGTANPAYDLHVNGHGATAVFVDGGASSDAFVRFGTAGTAKSYVKLGSGGNFIVAQDATGGDLELKAKPGGVSTTYLALDGGRTALTASVPLSCSLSVTASYFYGDGRHLTNVPAGGLVSTYTNATDNYVLTSAGAGSINGEANLTFDGSTLTVTGDATVDKNHTATLAATITGLEVDFDKTGTSTSNNTMYGVKVDMDNTTATNGTNTMYGLHVTPTLTHAADAGDSLVFGAFINAQGGTNGTGIAQAARFEAGGGDLNFGIVLDCEDGGTDFRIESSADNGDYFQIQTTTHGATTITTVDDDATAAHLTFAVDGDINLNPVGGNVLVAGTMVVENSVNPIIETLNSANNAYGAVINLHNTRDGNAGQVDDFCGGVVFLGKDSTSADTQYSKISTKISSPTNTSEAGRMIFEVTTTGSAPSTYLTLDGARNAITSSVDTLVQAKLHQSGAVYRKYNEQSTNYTLTTTDNVVYMNTAGGDLTASLPDATTVDGIIYTIKNTNSNNLVLDGDGSQTIDGTATISGPIGKAWTIQAFQGIWMVLGSSG